jgi:hypothetical protein
MSASSIYGCGASRALSLTRKDLSPVLRAEIRRL